MWLNALRWNVVRLQHKSCSAGTRVSRRPPLIMFFSPAPVWCWLQDARMDSFERGLKPATTFVLKWFARYVVAGFSPRSTGDPVLRCYGDGVRLTLRSSISIHEQQTFFRRRRSSAAWYG